MTLLDLVAALRLRLDDEGGDTGSFPTGYKSYWEYDDSGCLFKNSELTRFLNEAENEFCRRVPLVDSTDFPITLAANISAYELDPVILSVQRVYSPTRNEVLPKLFAAEADGFNTPTAATRYLTNLQSRHIHILGTPTQAETLQLTVNRLPNDPLLWSSRTTQEPEIALHFHHSLIDYACFLAFLKRDADTYDENLAMKSLALFDRAVGPSKSATDLDWTQQLANRRPKARAQFI